MDTFRNLARTFVAACTGLVLLLLSTTSALGAIGTPPGKVAFQGFLTDLNGNALGSVTPVNKTVVFRIYDASANGTIKWGASQVVTIDKGHFSVLLGEGSADGGNPFSADLSSVFAGADASDRYMEMVVEGVSITPRIQFLPAPYALLAKAATQLNDPTTGAALVANANGNVGIGTTNPGQKLEVAGNIKTSGDLQVGGVAYINYGTPSQMTLGYPAAVGLYADSANIAVRVRTGGTTYFQNAGGSNTFMSLNLTEAVITTALRVIGTVSAPTLTSSGAVNAASLAVSGVSTVGSLTSAGAVNGASSTITGTLTAGTVAGNGTIPIGGIIMWSGATTAVPAGWALCNGQTASGKVTPNLTDRFVVGAGGSYYAPGNTGGNNSVTISVAQLPAHNHTYVDAYFSESGGDNSPSGGKYKGSGDSDNDNYLWTIKRTSDNTGSGAAVDIRPPYYALAFIMRVL